MKVVIRELLLKIWQFSSYPEIYKKHKSFRKLENASRKAREDLIKIKDKRILVNCFKIDIEKKEMTISNLLKEIIELLKETTFPDEVKKIVDRFISSVNIDFPDIKVKVKKSLIGWTITVVD